MVALCISFAFFAVQMYVQPYKSLKLNFVKACSEIQIFATLLIALVLRATNGIPNADEEEPITRKAWGYILIVINVTITPLPVLYFFLEEKGHKWLKCQRICTGANPQVQQDNGKTLDTKATSAPPKHDHSHKRSPPSLSVLAKTVSRERERRGQQKDLMETGGGTPLGMRRPLTPSRRP